MFHAKIVGWSPPKKQDNPTAIGGILGSHTPIASMMLKGWLFAQSWVSAHPGEQLHPVRWTNISKGQVWSAPPMEEPSWSQKLMSFN